MATVTKYKANATTFVKSNGRITPTMTKSDLSTKTQIKTWVSSAIDTAAATGGMINVQVLIKAVEVDE